MDLKVNQEMACSIRARHQKDQRGVCSLRSTFNSLFSLQAPFSSDLCLSRNGATVERRSMIYSLLCFFFFAFSLNVLWRGRETLNRSTKQCIFGSTHFSVCVCARLRLLRVRTGTGSAPPLGAALVLEVGVSGAPRSKRGGRVVGS